MGRPTCCTKAVNAWERIALPFLRSVNAMPSTTRLRRTGGLHQRPEPPPAAGVLVGGSRRGAGHAVSFPLMRTMQAAPPASAWRQRHQRRCCRRHTAPRVGSARWCGSPKHMGARRRSQGTTVTGIDGNDSDLR
jgi:hypothetical protein